jgi:hypothetical protein
VADPEAFAAALELFDKKDLEEQMMAVAIQGTDAAITAQIEVYREAGTSIPDALVERLRTMLLGEVKTMVGQLSGTIRIDAARIYARHFTAAELRELKALQAHPVMKKAERLMPQMTAEMNEITSRATAERMPVIQAKAKALLEQWLREQMVPAPDA